MNESSCRTATYAPPMDYRRMPIEAESPEQFGYDRIRFIKPVRTMHAIGG